MGELQERITSNQKRFYHLCTGCVRSCRRLYRSCASNCILTFRCDHNTWTLHRRARNLTQQLIHSPQTSRILDPNIVGKDHYDVARGVQKVLQDIRFARYYCYFRNWWIIQTKINQIVAELEKIQKFLSQPMFVAEVFTGSQVNMYKNWR